MLMFCNVPAAKPSWLKLFVCEAVAEEVFAPVDDAPPNCVVCVPAFVNPSVIAWAPAAPPVKFSANDVPVDPVRFPDESKLQPIRKPTHDSAVGEDMDAAPVSEMAAVFNENVRRLNGLLFTYLDYAVIGERL